MTYQYKFSESEPLEACKHCINKINCRTFKAVSKKQQNKLQGQCKNFLLDGGEHNEKRM